MIAFWVRTRDRVPGFLGFGYFQHAAAHVALQFDDLRTGWFWCIGERPPDIGRPPQRIGIAVLDAAHFFLLEGKSHFPLALAFFLDGGFRSHGTQSFAGS